MENKKDRFHPQLDSSIQTKARGLLHMEHEFIAHHIRRSDSGPREPHNLDATRKVLRRLLEALDGLQAWIMDSRSTRNTQSTRWTPSPDNGFQKRSKHSMNVFRSTRSLQDSTTKSSGLLTGVKYPRVGSSSWMPTSSD